MAYLFKYIPLAIRVSVAGGATYGTVKAGAWSNSEKSQEKLEQLQQSLEGIREIEYPSTSQGGATTQRPSHPLGSNPPPTPSLGERLALSWNSAVKTVCRSVTSWKQLSASSESHSGSEVQEAVRGSRHWAEK